MFFSFCICFCFYIFVAPCLFLAICFFKHFISRRLPPVVSWGGSSHVYILVQLPEHVWWGPLHSAQNQPYGFSRQYVRVSGLWGQGKRTLRMLRSSEGGRVLQDPTVTYFLGGCECGCECSCEILAQGIITVGCQVSGSPGSGRLDLKRDDLI